MVMLYEILSKLIQLYSWALIIYILMSWFPNARETSIGQFLARICEPYLEPFRRFVPSIGMIDISPIVAFIVLNLAQSGLYQLFRWLI
ncbi:MULTISPECIES: YggT family protein [Bacillaceae]|jgi:YggT family protein|uniref:YggT family protein n=2 Tax=Rossellomorea vietnamensis TaxID=218284 RepID=A0A6I6UGX9_9BACI|nr:MULTISPECIES: YggT family protein [Bacillaceae]MCA0148711.1 YggT family protein [Rossellomorea vietnamensis]MCC5802694.1 YggT family protein [Rossellomorea vietnamensis]PFG06796.1 YggT family protein [Bacillus sp. es.034]QHE61228.1 YggT family protein [Rossellomorea vietnamensis]UTE75323.1 YggT family protein [Rossellomorea sp. KS-H15a]